MFTNYSGSKFNGLRDKERGFKKNKIKFQIEDLGPIMKNINFDDSHIKSHIEHIVSTCWDFGIFGNREVSGLEVESVDLGTFTGSVITEKSLFEHYLEDLDFKNAINSRSKMFEELPYECDCGGEKAKTTHSHWCRTKNNDC